MQSQMFQTPPGYALVPVSSLKPNIVANVDVPKPTVVPNIKVPKQMNVQAPIKTKKSLKDYKNILLISFVIIMLLIIFFVTRQMLNNDDDKNN